MRVPDCGSGRVLFRSTVHYCLRCSYGAPLRHDDADEAGEWQGERNLGIGSQSKAAVTRLLKEWASRGAGRCVDAIETRECAPSEPQQGLVWWREPDEEEEEQP